MPANMLVDYNLKKHKETQWSIFESKNCFKKRQMEILKVGRDKQLIIAEKTVLKS